MFKIQKTLDRTQPFGRIFGVTHNNACYDQNNLEFGGDDERLTPYTPEETEQEEAYAALQEKRDAAEAAGLKATESVKAVVKEEADVAKANAPEKEVDPEKPDFSSGWTKAMLVTHAMEKFHLTLDVKAKHATLVTQLEELYEK